MIVVLIKTGKVLEPVCLTKAGHQYQFEFVKMVQPKAVSVQSNVGFKLLPFLSN